MDSTVPQKAIRPASSVGDQSSWARRKGSENPECSTRWSKPANLRLRRTMAWAGHSRSPKQSVAWLLSAAQIDRPCGTGIALLQDAEIVHIHIAVAIHVDADAVELAQKNPEKQVVFFGVGFETTAPANAMSVHLAKRRGLKNFSLLGSHVLVPPAIEAIMSSPGNKVQDFSWLATSAA